MKTDRSIWFKYDAMQNRVVKHSKANGSELEKRTYYIRDAQGKVMATYAGYLTNDGDPTWDSLRLTEQHIYGSARVGTALTNVKLYPEIPVNPHLPDSSRYPIFEGWKHYEISNHLGNVLAVITDRKRAGNTSGADILWYDADVVSAQQYYPFGMLMPDTTDVALRRQYSNPNCFDKDYRYGFNGKEGDDEVKGDDNQQDYGMRIYDPRAGRFLSVDPISSRYPELTPYQFASSRPIDGIDLDGLEYENYKSCQIVKEKGVAALPIITFENGFGPLIKATYSLEARASKAAFQRLKESYTTNPGILHNPNNAYAEYIPQENPYDDDNYLGVGDNMYIDIVGPFNDYVRFTDINVNDNSFEIKAATLYGHTDAGTISFRGSFNESTGIIAYSIHNETTNNLGLDALSFQVGRLAQKDQWTIVLNNVESSIGGQTLSKNIKQEISIQKPKKGDGVKVINENLLSGSSVEEYKEHKDK